MRRLFDIAVASTVLAATAPLLVATAGLVRWRIGGPALFRQTRTGLDGRPFTILKFRTMRDAFGPDGEPLPDGARLTKLGKVLRDLSIDELPNLLNVLRGDMSLIGPRPLVDDYRTLYSVRQWRRHEVKPGLTGWAQVNGRNSLSWDEKFEFDVWYVENRSWRLDLAILLRTVACVVARDGISMKGAATVHRFEGAASDTRLATTLTAGAA